MNRLITLRKLIVMKLSIISFIGVVQYKVRRKTVDSKTLITKILYSVFFWLTKSILKYILILFKLTRHNA